MQLLTVPSCDLHNQDTSHDDEYLLYVLAMSLTANQLGKHQFLSKVVSAVSQRPALMTRILSTKQSVTVHDTLNDTWARSVAFEVDDARLSGVLEKIARGIFFVERKEVWPGSFQALPEFTLVMDDAALNDESAQLYAKVDAALVAAPHKGANPDVFSYQIVSLSDRHLLRLRFYGESRVTCLFNP